MELADIWNIKSNKKIKYLNPLEFNIHDWDSYNQRYHGTLTAEDDTEELPITYPNFKSLDDRWDFAMEYFTRQSPEGNDQCDFCNFEIDDRGGLDYRAQRAWNEAFNHFYDNHIEEILRNRSK